jgi:hypothetical protein
VSRIACRIAVRIAARIGTLAPFSSDGLPRVRRPPQVRHGRSSPRSLGAPMNFYSRPRLRAGLYYKRLLHRMRPASFSRGIKARATGPLQRRAPGIADVHLAGITYVRARAHANEIFMPGSYWFGEGPGCPPPNPPPLATRLMIDRSYGNRYGRRPESGRTFFLLWVRAVFSASLGGANI